MAKRTILASSQTLDAIDRCLRELHFSSVEKREPFEKPDYLERGDIIHTVLEKHYSLVKIHHPYNDIVEEAIQTGRIRAAELELPVEEVEKVINSYREYANYYQNDRGKVIEVEKAWIFKFYESDEVEILFQGKTDLLYQYENVSYSVPWDHKSQTKKTYHTNLSNQFAMTALAWDSRTLIVNNFGLQTTVPVKEKFRRESLHFTKSWLADWSQQTLIKILDADAKLQNGIISPRFTSCYRCRFKEICESVPELRQHRLETRFKEKERFELFPENEEEDALQDS